MISYNAVGLAPTSNLHYHVVIKLMSEKNCNKHAIQCTAVACT